MGDDSQIPLLNSNSSSTLKTDMSLHSLGAQQLLLEQRLRVGIIGTGVYALALVKRLTSLAGCDVVMGSRKPELRRGMLSASGECCCGVELTSIRDCISSSDIVIVAIHREYFRETLQDVNHLLAGKVVIDVSNRDTRKAVQSNAECLAKILPGALVVKAFNSVSAYTMEDVSDTGSSSVVYVAGNDVVAREKVITLAQAMGFRAVNLGLLTSARWMEDVVLRVFSLWKVPIALATGIFALAWLYIVYIYFIERPKPAYSWEQLFIKVSNKPICMTAMAMMGLTYLPGQLASVLQVYYGTKHRRFPDFMDTWLKCRKQLGLVSFFLVTLHAILSVLMMSPTYYSSWYHKATVTIPANTTLTSDLVLTPTKQWMTWKGEAASGLGILAFLLMAIVALTSIRSIGDSLNWSEWRCVQSHLGYVVLVVSAAHVTAMGAPGWKKRGFPDVFKSITFLSVLLPLAVLAMKLAFSLPPLSGYLAKIRRGWEREGAKLGLNSHSSRRESGKASGGCCSGPANPPGKFRTSKKVTDDCCGGSSGDLEQGKSGAVGLSSVSSSSASKFGDSIFPNPVGDSKHCQVTFVQVEVNGEPADDAEYTGISLHKDCTCADQRSPQLSLPQCRCSNV